MINDIGKVVLVSSDVNLNQALFDQFELLNFLEIDVFHNLADYIKHNDLDLIVYNTEPKKLELLEIENHIRINKFSCEIIILNDSFGHLIKSKLNKTTDCIFIDKPFNYEFFEQVIFDIIKRKLSKVIYLNNIKFYPIKKLIVNKVNLEIRLTEKESDILLFLYNSANKVITKEILLNEVWGYSRGITTHTLETHLYHLRKKLDSDNLISTEKGGYLLSI